MEKVSPPKSDNKFTAKCRVLQSRYRDLKLKEPHGFGPTKGSDKKYGNMLVNGEQTGSNFISKAAFDFAREKVIEKQVNKYLTIDEYRLFNNMLSSMPMCFNLFSDLRKLLIHSSSETAIIIRQLFSELDWIEDVTYIDVEFIPIPISAYTNDKSAFDAMIIVKDKNGKRGLISIETKYTDILGNNTSADTRTKDEIISDGKFFDPHLVSELKDKGYKQIHRNFLLTYIYAKKNGFKNFINVVISPSDDKLSTEEISEMKQHMTKFDNCIMKIDLEEFVQRGINCRQPEFSELMRDFRQRYLEFDGATI
jgi:hypothetical protein